MPAQVEHMGQMGQIAYRVFDGLDACRLHSATFRSDLVRASAHCFGCFPTCFDVDVAECKACSQFKI